MSPDKEKHDVESWRKEFCIKKKELVELLCLITQLRTVRVSPSAKGWCSLPLSENVTSIKTFMNEWMKSKFTISSGNVKTT